MSGQVVPPQLSSAWVARHRKPPLPKGGLVTWLSRPACQDPALCSSIPSHAGFGCGASCTRTLPASSGGGPGAFITTLPHWGKALSPPWEGQEEKGTEPKAGRLGEWGFPGLVSALTHFAQHLPCTDWGKSGGPARKNQRCPVRGLERKGNLESSLKGEPCGQEGVEENKGLWETREALCASKGLWV